MIDEKIWFYTLSTISQTCAAILALGGTFVIFKLDKLQTALNNYRGRVISIIRVWRGNKKTEDKFFDESNDDVLSQYKTIIRDNDDNIFDRKGLNETYTRYERYESRSINVQSDELWIFDDGLRLDHQERKRWCNRMVDLLEKNVIIEKTIYRYLKIALMLLTIAIISSIFMLNFLPEWRIDNYIFYLITSWSIGSIIFSGFSVWKVAKYRPIL